MLVTDLGHDLAGDRDRGPPLASVSPFRSRRHFSTGNTWATWAPRRSESTSPYSCTPDWPTIVRREHRLGGTFGNADITASAQAKSKMDPLRPSSRHSRPTWIERLHAISTPCAIRSEHSACRTAFRSDVLVSSHSPEKTRHRTVVTIGHQLDAAPTLTALLNSSRQTGRRTKHEQHGGRIPGRATTQ